MSDDERWTIRDYRPDDEAACRACVVALQEAERAIDPRLLPGEAMADDYWRTMLARSDTYAGAMFVAESGGAVCGLVLVLTRVPPEDLNEPPGEHAVVAELVVLEGQRGRGIGAALLDAAERHARMAGATELRIGVLAENAPARRLYLAFGFAPYLETLAKPLRIDAG